MPAEKYTGSHRGAFARSAKSSPTLPRQICGIAGARGTAPPAGIDLKAITGLFADKPKVLQAMKDSFGHFRNALVALNDADADKPQRCSTVRPPCADLSS